MITSIGIGSESVLKSGGCGSVSVDAIFMGSIFHQFLIDPVKGSPPENGKPLLLSYLMDGVKERTC
jgi:hypothetical protein